MKPLDEPREFLLHRAAAIAARPMSIQPKEAHLRRGGRKLDTGRTQDTTIPLLVVDHLRGDPSDTLREAHMPWMLQTMEAIGAVLRV